ncbi:MAG TPA: TGS domain-containing protein [Promineifilum sp.]|nr:TGS domain-containing protein [Promineifilum sp.]
MPANLTPQYKAAEERYRKAKTVEEKIDALEEMLAVIPKHKGTEKMRADLKRRMAKHRDEGQQKGGARSGLHIVVEREGVAQIIIIGPPNTGKSSLLAAITNATPEIADYPYTTQRPVCGMLHFENIQFQLVDTPAISSTFFESWLRGVIRNGDAVLLVADLSSDSVVEDLDIVFQQLTSAKIELIPSLSQATRADSIARCVTVLMGNKADSEGSGDREHILREFYPDLPYQRVSALTGEGLEPLGAMIYDMLRLVRVYTKPRGHDPDRSRPFVLPQGSTVVDVAKAVHKDLAENLKFARVWGQTVFEGQRVPRDYVVQEGDVIEVNA